MQKLMLVFLIIFLSSCADKEEEKELKCSINKDEFCIKDNIKYSLKNRPIRFMQESILFIEGLKNYDNLNIRIYGLNMDMGVLKAQAVKKDKIYEVEFLLNFCFVKDMRYRIELFNGEKSLKKYIDFDMKR
ncbi:hypothetical protein [Campylobacter canadensis]|uniref:Lipoprotein n=1 Tax=Campylobacter canadensis TaxID=449520 RepID=A0ABS7WRG1_9BACT|nr:hypothetical protein [Campylobacter canadensis]MBZ7987133.1 hypothetical protein [Campylobacter canadensis]MBZ7997200.1 hypothetical protein [Campylobacter canadensis]MBZ7998243.1 hypothetical protein [Campylobacter canadensis]MBZ7999772.1 hypothetical protein [Campylobacter canadensis]MBZ8002534.1 hypothetical protein [Campylobacter canadensis]